MKLIASMIVNRWGRILNLWKIKNIFLSFASNFVIVQDYGVVFEPIEEDIQLISHIDKVIFFIINQQILNV